MHGFARNGQVYGYEYRRMGEPRLLEGHIGYLQQVRPGCRQPTDSSPQQATRTVESTRAAHRPHDAIARSANHQYAQIIRRGNHLRADRSPRHLAIKPLDQNPLRLPCSLQHPRFSICEVQILTPLSPFLWLSHRHLAVHQQREQG